MDNNIEKMLRSAVSHAAPDVLENILQNCDKEKGAIIYMEKKNHKVLKGVLAACAAFALVIAGVFLAKFVNIGINTDNLLAATVSLDVNPAVELEVNKNEKVISAKGLNNDGILILGNMDLKGSDLEIAVNAVIGSMLKNGYIDDMANSVLLSVSGVGDFDADGLQTKLATKINGMLSEAAILSQNVSNADSGVKALADKYGISVGKANLINEIVEKNDRHSFSELAGLSINELNIIGGNTEYKNVSSEGTASEKAYIGADAALKSALDHAKLKKDAVSGIEIDLDYEHGCMVYEIEFNRGSDEYEYDINALTGEVIACDNEINGEEIHKAAKNSIPATDPNEKSSGNTSNVSVSKDEAVNIALKKAGLTADKVKGLSVHLDRDDGVLSYEIEFFRGSYEYSCDVNAETGRIIEFDKEYDDDAEEKQSKQSSGSSDVIGKDEAIKIALKKAGVSESEAGRVFADLEKDDGKLIYEIEFKVKAYEYSVEIDAATGSILDYEKEIDD